MKPLSLLLILTSFSSLEAPKGQSRISSFEAKYQKRFEGFQTGNDIELQCDAEGSSSNITIRKLGELKELSTSRAGEQNVIHLIQGVTCKDTGLYACVLDSSVLKTAAISLYDCPPQPCISGDVNVTVFADVGKSVSFSLCFISYGRVINISINGSSVEQGNMSSVWSWEMINSTTDVIKTLNITHRNMTSLEYGSNTVRVNGITSKQYHLEYNVTLRPRGPPDCPVGLKVTDQGLYKIMLSWIPGLDGGFRQLFHVLYSHGKNETWNELNTTEESYTTIDGLKTNTTYFFAVESTNKFRPAVNESACNNLLLWTTGHESHNITNDQETNNHLSSAANTSSEEDVDNVRVMLMYFPPVLVVAAAVTLTVVLAWRKEKRLAKQQRETNAGRSLREACRADRI